jgi:transposase
MMNFGDYLKHREMVINTPLKMPSENEQASQNKEKGKKTKQTATKRRNYRSYTPIQIQEMLDLVMWEGMSARKAGLITGIVVRTARHYVKQFREDNQKRLLGIKNSFKGGNNRELSDAHTTFLIDYYDNNSTAVLWEARDAILEAFPDIGTIDLSNIYRHLVQHVTVTLKKLEKIIDARTKEETLNQRREKVLEWKADKNMKWLENCVFIDEAGFNMRLRRNFGRSKRGQPAKAKVPSKEAYLYQFLVPFVVFEGYSYTLYIYTLIISYTDLIYIII